VGTFNWPPAGTTTWPLTHADPGADEAAEQALRYNAFDRVSVKAPWIEVNTTRGYRPGLSRIVAFANGEE